MKELEMISGDPPIRQMSRLEETQMNDSDVKYSPMVRIKTFYRKLKKTKNGNVNKKPKCKKSPDRCAEKLILNENNLALTKTTSDFSESKMEEETCMDSSNFEKIFLANGSILLLDKTQDTSEKEKTTSSYVSLFSKPPYVHKSRKREKKSVSALIYLPNNGGEASTRTAKPGPEVNTIAKVSNNLKINVKLKNKQNEEKSVITAVEDFPKSSRDLVKVNVLNQRGRVECQGDIKRKIKDCDDNDFTFGSTVKDEKENKKENKKSKPLYGTETFPPPTSLQILQRHANFELDDLTGKVRMVGEGQKSEDVNMQPKYEDSILAALKMKQNVLVSKGQVIDKPKEVTPLPSGKVRDYPKPRKITEVYKNEELLNKKAKLFDEFEDSLIRNDTKNIKEYPVSLEMQLRPYSSLEKLQLEGNFQLDSLSQKITMMNDKKIANSIIDKLPNPKVVPSYEVLVKESASKRDCPQPKKIANGLKNEELVRRKT
uniref:ATPase family AAA domain-containing protein 5 n=1 Tax=Parastrongyloides trichosuri TaxID=131310 RepID=A0A0N4Z793_PARTI